MIIARYGEVHLKGKNRNLFLRRLTDNLRHAVGKDITVTLKDGRYMFDANAPIQKICNTFGITSASKCKVVKHNEILRRVSKVLTFKKDGVQSFRVNVNRADKKFPHTSMQFAAMCGEAILKENQGAKVDLHNPDAIINIDIRENDKAFIYHESIQGAGGMPVGTAGKALVLLSGGIDSPVAAYLAAKRGLEIQCIHFASPPYTSDFALDKVHRLVRVLEGYCKKIKLYIVPFTEIQKEIKDKTSPEYLITIMRRFMIRISTQIAKNTQANCIITGENLGQVASQTIQGITTNNICAGDIPILRPLVTYDKSEIITLAKKIGTYDISIEPHADCCTVFVPSSPVIAPTIKRCEREEHTLDTETLVKNAVSNTKLD